MGGQLKEIQQGPKALVPEGGKVFLIKLPVALRAEVGKEGVLTGGKGEPGNVFGRDGLPVQGNGPMVGEEAKDTLHQGGFARTVLSKQPHDLPLRDLQIHAIQGGFISILLDDLLELQHRAHPPTSALQKRVHCPGTRQDAGVHFT